MTQHAGRNVSCIHIWLISTHSDPTVHVRMPIYGLFHANTRPKHSVFTSGHYSSSDDLVNKHVTCTMSLLGHTIFSYQQGSNAHPQREQREEISLGTRLPHTLPNPPRHMHTCHIPHSHTPSHTHCMKPYLSVDLYTDRSGSSQSSITAPSSRPCGFHDNRIIVIIIKYRYCLL